MGDEGGGYGDSNGGGWGSNNSYGGSNNNYADSYNNYSYSNDTNDFANKYSSYNDTKSNDDSRGYTMSKTYEDSTPKSYEPSSKAYEEPAKTYERSNDEARSEPISTPATKEEINTSTPVVSSPESQSNHLPKTEKESETKKSKEVDDFGGGDDDDDDDFKFKRDTPNENITVTTAEINTPPGATCDHKTLAVLLGSVTAGDLSSEAAHDAAEMQALASLHDNCCNGRSRLAADDINLDDTKENTDLLNDSSETRPLEDEKKPQEEDDCMLSVLSFCVTCCECVIS